MPTRRAMSFMNMDAARAILDAECDGCGKALCTDVAGEWMRKRVQARTSVRFYQKRTQA